MLHIDRNGLGLNEITYISGAEKKPITETVTLYGKGLIDKIALAVLHFLGTFIKDLKPIKFQVEYNKNDRYLFPVDMKITRRALKTLLKVTSQSWENYNEIELTSKTKDKVLSEVLKESLKNSGKGVVFQESVNLMSFKLHSEITNRIIGLKLQLSEKLSEMGSDTGEFVLPIDEKTGRYVPREDPMRKKCYEARISITNTSEGVRECKLFKSKDGKEPSFSTEAHHVLSETICKLKDFVSEPLTMKQISKKLHDDAFGDKYLELGKIPIKDKSDQTKVALNPEKDIVLDYELANHMKLNGKKYIGMMYPSHDDQWKFWEMIQAEESPVIVKLHDAGDNAKYWPSKDEPFDWSETGLKLKVELKNEVQLTEYLVKREFEVTKNGKPQTVFQIDFLGWPDGDTPNPSQILRMLDEVNKAYEEALKGLPKKLAHEKVAKAEAPLTESIKDAQAETKTEEKDAEAVDSHQETEPTVVKESSEEDKKEELDISKSVEVADEKTINLKSVEPKVSFSQENRKVGPITVHCAAGHGRTGTFIGIHSTLEQKKPDFIELLYKMRQQRSKQMVETVEQFHFLKNIHQEQHKAD